MTSKDYPRFQRIVAILIGYEKLKQRICFLPTRPTSPAALTLLASGACQDRLAGQKAAT
ncbi:hypothetical protein [Massilia sp. CCM 8734]|uniref:hypothetical protein n=1 Tax=Massilia sp. CCM 8734 TaxID=2609283 RepID=UPI00141F40CB|nr:hypothetical protein [Massilia sp. CCM 8734]